MNLCRCEQGHFYDKEKYSSCPHCAGGSASDEKRTEAFTEDLTVPLSNEQPMQPMAATVPSMSQVIPPVVPTASDPIPGAGMFENQGTVPMGGMTVDTLTVPLESIFSSDKNTGTNMEVSNTEEDSDHTIGFYDDVFSEAAGIADKLSAAAAPPKSVTNKVSTPCVGWLIALGGEHIGTDFRLKAGKNFIGRSSKMDISLTEDKSVSRDSHAIVVYEPKAHLYLVQPGESSSLVYRNDEVVLTPTKLEAYDMITVGDINLLFLPLCGARFNWGDLLEEMKKKNKQEG